MIPDKPFKTPVSFYPIFWRTGLPFRGGSNEECGQER